MSVHIHPVRAGFGHAFFVQTGQDLLLVDTGSPGMQKVLLDQLKRLAPARLRLIYITHAHMDHYGSAAAIRRETGAPIAIHPADAAAMAAGTSPLGSTRQYGLILRLLLPLVERLYPPEPAQADLLLGDGMELPAREFSGRTLHTPGHTPGSCSLVLESGEAFVGDLISRNPRPGLQHLAATRWEDLPASLEHLLAAHPRLVYTGHSPKPLPGSILEGFRRATKNGHP